MPRRSLAVLLDLDDTLIADGAAVDAALAATWGGVVADPVAAAALVREGARGLWRAGPHHRRLRELGVASWEALWAELTEPAPWADGAAAWVGGYQREVWRRSLAGLGMDPARAEELGRRFRRERRARCVPFPGVPALLTGLRARGPVAVVTNGIPELQRFKVRQAGIGDLVDDVVVSADVGAAKPDRRVFRHALDRLGADPAGAVMVGDSLARDIAGAAALGMRTVWVSSGRPLPAGAARPTAVVEDVSQLAAALDRLPPP